MIGSRGSSDDVRINHFFLLQDRKQNTIEDRKMTSFKNDNCIFHPSAKAEMTGLD